MFALPGSSTLDRIAVATSGRLSAQDPADSSLGVCVQEPINATDCNLDEFFRAGLTKTDLTCSITESVCTSFYIHTLVLLIHETTTPTEVLVRLSD